jgi:hypothetical protein
MMHPVGSLPPQVYWRRRIMVGGTLAAIVLLVLTVYVLSSNGTKAEDAAKTATRTSAPRSPSGAAPGGSSSVSSSVDPSSTSSNPGSASDTAGPSAGAVPACIAAQLTVAAASSAPSYKVGDQPVLTLQVTNNGPANCTQDLADSQVELRVYNGAARVWGSHDCLVQPGTSVKTLVAGTTVGVQVTWSGLSSEPGCAGTRQRVGAGTYTLYPYLAGAQGTTSQFSIAAT